MALALFAYRFLFSLLSCTLLCARKLVTPESGYIYIVTPESRYIYIFPSTTYVCWETNVYTLQYSEFPMCSTNTVSSIKRLLHITVTLLFFASVITSNFIIMKSMIRVKWLSKQCTALGWLRVSALELVLCSLDMLRPIRS